MTASSSSSTTRAAIYASNTLLNRMGWSRKPIAGTWLPRSQKNSASSMFRASPRQFSARNISFAPKHSTCPVSGQHTASRWHNASKSYLLQVLDTLRSDQPPEKKKQLWRAMLSEAELLLLKKRKKTVSNH